MPLVVTVRQQRLLHRERCPLLHLVRQAPTLRLLVQLLRPRGPRARGRRRFRQVQQVVREPRPKILPMPASTLPSWPNCQRICGLK